MSDFEPRSGLLEVRRDGAVVRAELADPGRANALSPPLIDDLTALYREPWLESGVRAVVLAAAGKHFSAGADLAHLRSLRTA